jgi:lysozyme family protein
MESNFQRALPLFLKHEGGFVNHPNDPGGATNKGVTIATYRRYINRNGTVADLKRITDAQVAIVYKQQYWDRVQGDLLPSGVDYAVADFAINSGPSRGAKHLQAVVGVAQDGQIGPITLAAVRERDPSDIIRRLCANRLAFMKRIRGGSLWKTFGRGWQRRVDEVEAVALRWASEKSRVEQVVEDAAAKDRISTTELTSILVGAGGTATAVKETVEAVNDAQSSLMSAGPWVLLALVVAGGAFYIWLQRRRKKKEAREALQ